VVGEGGFELAEVGAGGFEIGGEADEAVAGGVLDGAGFPSFDAVDADAEAFGEGALGEAEALASGLEFGSGQEAVSAAVGVGAGEGVGIGLSVVHDHFATVAADFSLDFHREGLGAYMGIDDSRLDSQGSDFTNKALHSIDLVRTGG
jgi:hypothetical protein